MLSCERRQLLAHLGFEDVLPQAEGAAEAEAALAAAAESLQLTSPRDGAAGTSPPRNGVADTNGDAAFLGNEGGPVAFCHPPLGDAFLSRSPSSSAAK